MSGDCSCGKPAIPLGSPKPQVQVTTTPGAPSGGLAAQTQSFTLQLANGGSQRFVGSKLEAQAQAVRIGARVQF